MNSGSIIPVLQLLATGAEEGHAPAGPVAHGPWWVALIVLLPMLGAMLCGVAAALKVKSKLPAFLTVTVLV